MRRSRTDSPSMMLTPMTACRKGFILFGCFLILCLFAPLVFAEDFGLSNPAAKDFAEFQSDTQGAAGSFAKTSPAFSDRSLPTPEKSETIRQVSTNENDPFPTVTQPMGTQPFPAQPQPVFDWGNPAPAAPNNPLLAQNNVIFYDPNAGNLPQFVQVPQQYPQQVLQQYPQQYVQQYIQQYPQGYFMNPSMMDATSLQYGFMADPYSVQEVPDDASFYQALWLQEMARRQMEEAQIKTNNGKETDAEEAKKKADATWTLNHLMPLQVSSPLGETMLVCAKTISPFSTPTGPDKGVGMPLVNKSWLDHPWYFGGFVGAISGSDLVADMIKQKNGGNGGFIFGYNFNEYWGIESRLHFASIDIYDTDKARQLFAANYQLQFPDLAVPPLTTRTNELTVLDAAVHYYPLGNAKWRPFFKYGLGFGHQKFVNTFGYAQSADIIAMPLGVGMRYWWNERIAIQADLIDNVVFSSKIAKTQNNIAFTVGLTYSLGSGTQQHPVQYWPATPSMGTKW